MSTGTRRPNLSLNLNLSLAVPASHAGLVLVLGVVAAHLWIATLGPGPDGFLFRGGVLREALGQSFLLVAPPLALYSGLRGAFADRDDPVAYLAIAGGALLSLLTGGALLSVV